MNAVDGDVLRGQNAQGVLALGVVKPESDTTVGTELSRSRHQPSGEAVPRKKHLRADRVMGRKKAD